jgi:hypothetical protein
MLKMKKNIVALCGYAVSMGLYCPRQNTVSSQKLITYGKATAGQFVQMHNKCAKHLRNIRQFWDNMDPNLKFVTRDLLETTGHDNNEWTILPSRHSMKTALYSVHAEAWSAMVSAMVTGQQPPHWRPQQQPQRPMDGTLQSINPSIRT